MVETRHRPLDQSAPQSLPSMIGKHDDRTEEKIVAAALDTDETDSPAIR